jgi:hypothetical protein
MTPAAPPRPKRTPAAPPNYARLEDIPNVGPATAADLRGLGIDTPAQLAGCEAFALYERLNRTTGLRHDPCVIDVFLAAIDHLGGAPAHPWWHYTPARKAAVARRAAAPSPSRRKGTR